MRQEVKDLLELFGSGYLIVIFVAINTYQVAHQMFLGATIVGFIISLIWTLNVKKVAFGTWRDRIAYAFGASLGTLTGMIITYQIYGG